MQSYAKAHIVSDPPFSPKGVRRAHIRHDQKRCVSVIRQHRSAHAHSGAAGLGGRASLLRKKRAAAPWPKSNGPKKPRAIAPGINPDVLEDLIQHGGKEVPQIEFWNVYLGGSASWATQDVRTIDAAIKLAMQHRRLNNVMLQYFPGVAMSSDMRESFVLDEAKPLRLDEPDGAGRGREFVRQFADQKD